jgi:hypothetical protein
MPPLSKSRMPESPRPCKAAWHWSPRKCLLVASVFTATLASCTNSTLVLSPSSAPTSRQFPISPSPAPTALPSPSPTLPTTAPPTPALTAPIVTNGEPTCASSQLQIALSPSLGGGAAGSFIVALGIWNRGSQPCKLRGWATVQFLNPAGGLVPTHWTETTSDFSGSAEPVAVSVLPCAASGGCASDSTPTAYVSIAGDDVISPCVTAASVRVLTPGATTPLLANLRVAGFQDGQVFCSDGKVSVLPVVSTFWGLGPPFT